MAVAVPAPEVASRDERHPFGVAALELARRLIGESPGCSSVSHTRGVTVAIVIADGERSVGVDIERTAPSRPRLVRRVLADGEVGDGIWPNTLAIFCAKEAAYKALPRDLQAGLTFRRVRLNHESDGAATAIRVVDNMPLAHVAVAVAPSLVVALAFDRPA